MNTAQNGQAACAEGQSCACPGGGSLVYQAEQSKAGAAAHFTFDSCVGDDGMGFDGEAVAVVSSKPILGLAKPGSSALFAARGTVFDKTNKIDLEFALLTEGGYALLAVEVGDGKIVIGSTPQGSIVVIAKQGTFHCSGGTCKGDDTGEEIEVGSAATANVPSSDDPPAAEEDPLPPEDGL
jgi:hypothetical protein